MADPSNIDPTAKTVASIGEGNDLDGVSGEAAAVTATDPGRSQSQDKAASSELIGKHLAHFRIDELVGRGGMGEVYKATDLSLERPVAIKVLAREIADDRKRRQRFFREARSQARVQHANVCHIYYIGEEDGVLFFAMEYIEGESLQAKLERDGAIEVSEAVEICRQAALGLREANRHGFTHRDIKPSNLMLNHNGTVKVVDFGLVKASAETSEGMSGNETTIEGTAIVGTPLYMPPEQAKGEKVDFRSDMYSLGATLHHLVGGKPPFEGNTPMAVVSRHLSEKRPRLSRKRRTGRAPEPIDVLCDRMMAKEPDKRFADYDTLLEAMENVSTARTRPAGFWVRAFALAFDMLLIQLVTVPIQLLTHLGTGLLFFTIAAFYSIGMHGRWGRTVGKSTLEIEVVAAQRHGPPGYMVAALRYLVQWGPMYLLVGAGTTTEYLGYTNATSIIGIVTMLVVVFVYPLEGALTAWFVPNKRTLWDRAAGTRVRYRRLRD